MPILLLALMLPMMAAGAPRRVKSGGKLTPKKTELAEAVDTVEIGNAGIFISGYDKPLKASKETFFVTNCLDETLLSIELDIEYIDADGLQLHRRTLFVPVTVPPGDTRAASIPTWDTQRTFCYKGSAIPKRARYIPYTVRIIVPRAVMPSRGGE